MHHHHRHSSNPPNQRTLANKHSSPAASPHPHPQALYSSCSAATAASRHSKGAPHISKGGITHPGTQSQIHPGHISKGGSPNFYCALTCSHTTADNIFPLATPLSHTRVSSCTRSHTAQSVTPARASSCKYPSAFITHWASSACTINRAASVFDENTGNFLEWRQLRNHPTLSVTWNTSYANKLGCLYQGIGTGPNEGKHIKDTNTLFPIPYDKIPSNRHREIIYSKVVCKVRPEKGDDANRTCIPIGRNNTEYPGDVGTPTGSIELVKLLVNSVLSQRNARLATMDLKNFYLNTLLDWPEYIRIMLADIPQEFINKYKLNKIARDSWIYFKMCRGMYGLHQAGILANKLLRDHPA
jgi:hypothetical protein